MLSNISSPRSTSNKKDIKYPKPKQPETPENLQKLDLLKVSQANYHSKEVKVSKLKQLRNQPQIISRETNKKPSKIGLSEHITINYNEFDQYDELEEVIETSSPFDQERNGNQVKEVLSTQEKFNDSNNDVNALSPVSNVSKISQ